MRAVTKALVMLACAAGLVAAIPTVWADGVCGFESEQKAAAAELNKAEAMERAGKLQEAFDKTVTIECADERRATALKQRVGKTLGGQEEKKGQLDNAYDWYMRTGLDAEADRVKLLHVKTKPGDLSVFDSAYEHFKRREAESTLKDLRALASKNADKVLADEERTFAARMESFAELNLADRWLRYLGDDQLKRMKDRAEKRGDTLLVKDGIGMLENALHYYELAEKPQKVQQVKDKCMRLADAYVKTGETATAVNFYNLAGANDKAAALEKSAVEASQKKEVKRQEQFKQEQDDLEKELGF